MKTRDKGVRFAGVILVLLALAVAAPGGAGADCYSVDLNDGAWVTALSGSDGWEGIQVTAQDCQMHALTNDGVHNASQVHHLTAMLLAAKAMGKLVDLVSCWQNEHFICQVAVH